MNQAEDSHTPRRSKVSMYILIILYVVMLLWWIILYITGARDTTSNYLYGLMLGLLPLVGGILGIKESLGWGFFSSALGKGIFFLSLGLVTWGIGTLIFAYYNLVLRVEVPYPSLADVAYIVSWPLWGWGMINISKATGAKYGLRNLSGKLMLFIVPILAIIASYYLLVVVARGGGFDFSDSSLVKIFLDLAYPLGDVVIMTLAAVIYGLSRNFLGGRYKIGIYLILSGFVLNYLADFSFSYTTTLETFYVGSWVDLLFTTTMFVLALGISNLGAKVHREDQPVVEYSH